ncbi:IclR family transcriptional regulator C-terminal domain-containing protein [Rhizobium sp. L1K21]|uniref:IclR family transcriptional regulator domain-containing protein n=1 Tax=Rhizobium sp. L1K21 TaxID=2954933 RepID=UPI00209252A8|nr:IclR family transcriptional regulator C-terminal domain-containing protein [Rhizobium sp. L1K21]MCO6187706.1 helix-turn-helix domain-containing protein [Rhizobium sp. L1K21]
MLNKTDFVASLAKGLRVLECFAAERSRLAIADVADATGLDRATARRCLLTLHELGYADYDGKFFSLTPRVLRLGVGALAALPLPQIVQPWLDQLSEQIGQSCSVSILDDKEIVYIARAAQKRVMSVGLMPGSRLPAHCTSMGRVLLAALPEGEARAIIEASDLTPRTPRSLASVDDIMRVVAEVRVNGYSLVDQEVELGLRSLAVPLVNTRGKVIAALNTGMAAIHGDLEQVLRDYLPALLRLQQSLRRLLN